ncbi:DNA gyrase subunit A [Candidatus Magnetomonas plexicatena]|uniref:DNA gyrase subunit A n=1 Tax=Candidatus Magnetomonas plexicatena TaxID=2552947 RepID=UPI001C75BE4C|nr:DNA gyrase subunit A [Nitrospirales bacterium LBB_01]
MSTIAISIEEEMKVSYLDYAMSVIIGRALPEVRDGLKPVQRRILYAMFREGLLSNRRYSKCAGVVGEVLKKYHPHGDSAVYDALVRMAQDFNMRYPLIDGQGNFGSMDGDPAAAYRYTEARLSKIAEELLNDIDKETVDYIPNFDETTEEPVVLPATVPNLIINGASGIAVGMATNIPPHNLGEVIDALLHLLETPESEIETRDLMKFVKGPDFPTGGIIFGLQGIINAYETGRGQIKVRAKANFEQRGRSGESIIVTELPYQVNKARLMEKIAELVREKKIEGISDLRDESDRDGIRMVIEIKRDEMAQVVLNNLYKHTAMESTFGVIMLALAGGQPRVMGLKTILSHFLRHRREIVIRRTRFDLRKAEERAHILEGLKIALDNLDAIITLIRAAETPEIARRGLITEFPLSEIQANAILEMRLQRLTGLEREKIVSEYNEIIKEIESLRAILASEALIAQIIKTELLEIREKYADERRTEIVADISEISVEDLITEEEMVITVSHNGYIKRNPLSEYRRQRRGGKGSIGMETREEDYVKQLFIGSTHDHILFFTNLGRLYWLKIYQIPEAGRATKGKAIVNLLQLQSGEKLATALPVKGFQSGYLMMFTKKGIVKKTQLSEFSNPRSKGVIAISIDDDDELIAVKMTDGRSDVIIGTQFGHAIRFNEDDVRDMGRGARGVIGIRLKSKDEVVSADVTDDRSTLLTVTELGYGKRTKAVEYNAQSRGGQGVISIKITEKGGKAVGLIQVRDDDEIMLITKAGKLIRTPAENIPVTGRNTQGVRIMDVGPENMIVGIGKSAEKDTKPEE